MGSEARDGKRKPKGLVLSDDQSQRVVINRLWSLIEGHPGFETGSRRFDELYGSSKERDPTMPWRVSGLHRKLRERSRRRAK